MRTTESRDSTDGRVYHWMLDTRGRKVLPGYTTGDGFDPDATFVKHARTDLPACLDIFDKIEALAAEWEADAREGLDSDADPYYLALAASLRATLGDS